MATFTEGSYLSFTAGADLSTSANLVAKLDSNGALVVATAGTDLIIGVIEKGAVEGDTASVAAVNGGGTFKVVAGGTIAAGDYLTATTGGKAIKTTTSGNRVFGRALSAAASGDVVEYLKCNEAI